MKRRMTEQLEAFGSLVLVTLVLVKAWDPIWGLVGIVLGSVMPLVLGGAIAYVVTIPTNFFERHLLPNSTSALVAAARRPLSLAIAAILLLVGLFLASSVLVPAFIDTLVMVQERSGEFINALLELSFMRPFRASITEFLEGDLMQSLAHMDIAGMISTAMGGTMGTIGTQVFGVVSTIMTGFFGIMFSFILLTDTSDVWVKVMNTLSAYLGPQRTEQLALVMGVADASFHNFIVRQCIEAAILGTVGTTVLLVCGYEYALGVGALMGMAALIPIVGYPVGLLCGAFMIVVISPWTALVYIVAVASAQMLEATLLLPHVGDPRTVLPPVWTTIGVTIGGGLAGFAGMLVAIPTAATIRQLIIIDMRRRNEAQQ